MYSPVGVIVTVPLLGAITGVVLTTKLLPFGSLSFGNTLSVTGVLMFVTLASSTATGLSLPPPFVSGNTVMITLAVSHKLGTPSSHTSYSKTTTPSNPVGGV